MFTVLGASGFIGRRLCEKLDELGEEYIRPDRDENLSGRTLGNVIYAIGLTADFREKPFETVEAHVSKLADVLRECDFESLLYLSSTRVYGSRTGVARETDPLRVEPLQAGDLYNISKAMGESLALHSGRDTRVARISNVFGDDFTSDNFLATIIKDAVAGREIMLRTSPETTKDYISIDDVVGGLINIATQGRERLYNLASGINISHAELAERLRSLTGCVLEFAPAAATVTFPLINIERMQNEFEFKPASVLDQMPELMDIYRKHEETPA